jgi:hypothetical protein
LEHPANSELYQSTGLGDSQGEYVLFDAECFVAGLDAIHVIIVQLRGRTFCMQLTGENLGKLLITTVRSYAVTTVPHILATFSIS